MLPRLGNGDTIYSADTGAENWIAFPGMEGLLMSLAEQSKRVYETRFRAELEAKHRDQFVAIEPDSESYFLGDAFIDAALAAKKAYPTHKSFVIRIGHDAAFHLGGCTS